jgi:hypothetical protein
MKQTDTTIRELRQRLDAIEDDVDNGRYRPGPWEALIRAVRARPDAERAQIAEGIGRVSRKLHMRTERITIGIGSALVFELVATVIGGVLLVLAMGFSSNVLAIIGAVIWVTTFQPLIKFGCGRAVGIHYDYAYLYGVEPRFKTEYGSYLASSRAARIVFHLSGMIGSPLAAWFIWSVLPQQMNLARVLCWYAMWALIATNVVTLIVGLAGIRRIGGFRLRDSSSGVAAAEMREGLGLQA